MLGVRADGTAYYVPLGVVWADDAAICCHLCGQWFRSVTAHLRWHGWTKSDYCDAFGLQRTQTLEAARTRTLRATAFAPRLIFEPAVREGSRAGRERARRGELAQAASAAARGRRHPMQRRAKTLAAIDPQAVAASNRRRGQEHRAGLAVQVAVRFGYPHLGGFVAARRASGHSLAEIDREAGLPRNWLSRHLAELGPGAPAAGDRGVLRADRRWRELAVAHGFEDAAEFLRDRHVARHRTVSRIAAETGISRAGVQLAMERFGVPRTPFAGSRYRRPQAGDD